VTFDVLHVAVQGFVALGSLWIEGSGFGPTICIVRRPLFVRLRHPAGKVGASHLPVVE